MLPINFQQLSLPKTPNYYLVCPANYCNVSAQQLSPIYSVSVNHLFNQWQQMIQQQPRISFIEVSKDKLQFTYIQRSLVFRFPDYIIVRFIPLSEQKSTLAIYSFSKYGYSDFGVNKKRVTLWLNLLAKQINHA